MPHSEALGAAALRGESLRGLRRLQALQRLYNETTTEIHFPVTRFPEKVKSFNLDKAPLAEGELQGIKGQYLILDTGVINIRKYTGYNIEFSAE